MSQIVNINNLKGLYVQPNSFSSVPDGTFEKLENFITTYDGYLKKRRGFFSFVDNITDPLALSFFKNQLLINYNSLVATIAPSGVMTPLGACVNVNYYPRYAEASGKKFITSDNGIKVLELLDQDNRDAGMPPALDLSVSLSGTSGICNAGNAVGYRICFVKDDNQGNRITSVPSSFASITNSLVTGASWAYDFGTGKVTITSTHGYGYSGTPYSVSLTVADAKIVTPTVVNLASVAALPTCTASGTGVGKTLTASAVGVLSVDGVNVNLNDLILVKNQANAIDNGVYKCTTAGTAGVAFVLTRSTSFDANAELKYGTMVKVSSGLVNTSGYFYITTDANVDVAVQNWTLSTSTNGVDENNMEGAVTASVTSATTMTYTPSSLPNGTGNTLSYGIPKTPSLTFSLPDSLVAGDKYQIYRTENTPEALEINIDTLQLSFEAEISSANITAKTITVTDNVNDIFRGAYLYTNPSTGGGSANANYPPPLAEDMALFKGSMFYANVTTKDTLFSSMVSSALLQNNDTITIDGAVYTAKTAGGSESVANKFFQVTSTGKPAFDIEATTLSLIRVINGGANSVYGFYLSSPDDIPGSFSLVSRTYGNPFTLACSRAGVLIPETASPASAQKSQTTTYPNQVVFSKQDQPEHVPSYAYLNLGSKDEAILRIVALRDSLIVIKANSVWRINGDAQNFSAIQLDNTVSCRAPDSVVNLNNSVFMASSQGIVSISDSSVSVISRSIEPLLTSVAGTSAFYSLTSAVAYESERSYILSTISKITDTVANTVYVYNTVNGSFSTWTTPFQSAIVAGSDDKMYYLGDDELFKERKNQNKLDYCEDSYTVTAGVKTGPNSIEFFSPIAVAVVGDVVLFNNIINRITSVDNSGAIPIITCLQPLNFVENDDVGLFKAIMSSFRSSPITLGAISSLKQFTEFTAQFRSNSCSILDINFKTDSSSGSRNTRWTNLLQVGWGLEQWGNFSWGEDQGVDLNYETISTKNLRTLIPLESQKGSWMQVVIDHSVAAESLDLQSFGLKVRLVGTKVSK